MVKTLNILVDNKNLRSIKTHIYLIKYTAKGREIHRNVPSFQRFPLPLIATTDSD